MNSLKEIPEDNILNNKTVKELSQMCMAQGLKNKFKRKQEYISALKKIRDRSFIRTADKVSSFSSSTKFNLTKAGYGWFSYSRGHLANVPQTKRQQPKSKPYLKGSRALQTLKPNARCSEPKLSIPQRKKWRWLSLILFPWYQASNVYSDRTDIVPSWLPSSLRMLRMKILWIR